MKKVITKRNIFQGRLLSRHRTWNCHFFICWRRGHQKPYAV